MHEWVGIRDRDKPVHRTILLHLSAFLAHLPENAIIDSTMAQLVVRQLDDERVLALKQRAARVGPLGGG